MQRPLSPTHTLSFWLVLGAVCASMIGCGSAPTERPDDLGWAAGGATGHQLQESTVSPCETGVVESCKVTVKQSNGIISCYEGVKYCVEQNWSRCMDVDEEPLL